MNMYAFAKVKKDAGVTTVEIDHAPANTLSSACIHELRALFRELDQDEETKIIILTGAGRFFVAGADIKEFVSAFGDPEKALALAMAGQALCNEVENMQKPVIAAINGPALGGGLELALGCHYRIAAHNAMVGLPELKLGLIPAFGGTQRLSKAVGTAVATQLILSSKQLTAEEAVNINLVQAVVPLEELLPTATIVAQSLIEGKSMTSVTRALACITHSGQGSLAEGLKKEREKFAELFATADAKEGIQAFIEKRKPQFTHS